MLGHILGDVHDTKITVIPPRSRQRYLYFIILGVDHQAVMLPLGQHPSIPAVVAVVGPSASCVLTGIFVISRLINDVPPLPSVTNSFKFYQYGVSPKMSH